MISCKQALLAHLDATGKKTMTKAMLNNLVEDGKGIKGVKAGKAVHKWFVEIVETGHCSYVEHVKAKGPR